MQHYLIEKIVLHVIAKMDIMMMVVNVCNVIYKNALLVKIILTNVYYVLTQLEEDQPVIVYKDFMIKVNLHVEVKIFIFSN